jgi:hypothetical protein
MNKQQLYTFGGALLASTALSGAANALTWGKVDGSLNWSTTPFSIANTLFSTTASTANTVSITPGAVRVAAKFSNVYSSSTASGTRFSVEITPSGAAFTTGTASLANAAFLINRADNASFTDTISASRACGGVIGFGTQFVLDGCTAAAGTVGGSVNHSVAIGGLVFSGVTFTNASGLATAGSSISLTGRVYNTATGGNFEQAAVGNVVTSAAPFTVTVTAASNVTASATTTPLAFTALSSSNISGSTLTMNLVTVHVTASGALDNDLTTLATAATETGSARITVSSSLLSSGAVATVHLDTSLAAGTDLTNQTVANFSGGSATFEVATANLAGSFTVRVAFNGTTAIPTAAQGTTSVVFGTVNGFQAPGTFTGTAAGSNQGGFRAEVNMFNSSPNGPYSSYLRIHNNGGVAGAATITVRNDAHDSGAMLGSSFTTAAIQPGGTMQLSAAEMEGTDTASGKLPSGGANIPTASRTGNYTIQVTGPIIGYVQHILFDGESVADLSAYRNGGATGANDNP